jgi:hypothetical protein
MTHDDEQDYPLDTEEHPPQQQSSPSTEQLTVVVRPVDEPEEDEQPDTDSARKAKPHRAPHYAIDNTDEDNPDLVIVWHEKVRQKERWKTRSTWYRHERRIALRATDLVDMRYAAKTNTTFTSRESRIDYLRRLHWMSHGPELVGFTIVWLAGIITLGTVSTTFGQVDPSGLLAPGLGLMLTLACGIAALRSWMRWAYTYLICTDVRIILIYHPPFKLPPKIQVAQLSRLQGCNADSSWLGNILNYGTIRSDTAANAKDSEGNDLGEWLEKGIRYVPEYVRLHALLTSPM